MKYRRFGRTELKMPVFSCGGMRFNQTWEDISWDKIEKKSQKNLIQILEKSLDLGINHIETARGYGTSEIQLGKALKNFDMSRIILQTKLGPEDTKEAFEKNLIKSFRLLDLEYIDLIALHGFFNTPETYDKGMRCYEVLDDWRNDGKIGFIGTAAHGNTELALKTVKSKIFDYINLHYYYIRQDLFPAVLEASKKDMGVFIISPNDKGGRLYDPPEKLKKLCAPLSPMQFNDLFCLKHPEIHTLSIGAEKAEDFDEHIQILDKIENAAKFANPIEKKLNKEIESTFGKNWRNKISKDIPSPENTPGEINISMILWLYTLAKAFDMVQYGKMRYDWLGTDENSEWFPGRSAENFSNEKIMRCLRDSHIAGKIPDMLRDAHELLKENKEEKRH